MNDFEEGGGGHSRRRRFFSILGLKATDFLDKIEQTAPPNRQNFLGAFGAENSFLLLSYPVHPN